MKISIDQKLFPLPDNSFKTIKYALGSMTDEYSSKVELCLNSLNSKLFNDTIMGYHGVQKFNEKYDVEIIIRLKEIDSE